MDGPCALGATSLQIMCQTSFYANSADDRAAAALLWKMMGVNTPVMMACSNRSGPQGFAPILVVCRRDSARSGSLSIGTRTISGQRAPGRPAAMEIVLDVLCAEADCSDAASELRAAVRDKNAVSDRSS
jgi:hypothetical protein